MSGWQVLCMRICATLGCNCYGDMLLHRLYYFRLHMSHCLSSSIGAAHERKREPPMWLIPVKQGRHDAKNVARLFMPSLRQSSSF